MKRTIMQNKRIWALVGQLAKAQGLQRDDAKNILRDLCKSVSNQESSKALTKAQANVVIGQLEDKASGRKAGGGRRGKPRAQSTITPQQQGALDQLKDTLRWDTRAYAAFCKRVIKTPWPQNPGDASKVYEGMEAILRRKFSSTELSALAQSILKHTDLSGPDERFTKSIIGTLKSRKRLGAGQIGILIKIGKRYGINIEPTAQSMAEGVSRG